MKFNSNFVPLCPSIFLSRHFAYFVSARVIAVLSNYTPDSAHSSFCFFTLRPHTKWSQALPDKRQPSPTQRSQDSHRLQGRQGDGAGEAGGGRRKRWTPDPGRTEEVQLIDLQKQLNRWESELESFRQKSRSVFREAMVKLDEFIEDLKPHWEVWTVVMQAQLVSQAAKYSISPSPWPVSSCYPMTNCSTSFTGDNAERRSQT